MLFFGPYNAKAEQFTTGITIVGECDGIMAGVVCAGVKDVRIGGEVVRAGSARPAARSRPPSHAARPNGALHAAISST